MFKVFLGTIMGAALITPPAAQAVEVLLDAPVEVKTTQKVGNKSLRFLAFRDATDCRTWYWVTSHFENVQGTAHMPNIIAPAYQYSVKGETRMTQTMEGSYRLTIAGNDLEDKFEKMLREKIAAVIPARVAQEAKDAPVSPRYNGCGTLSAENVNLVHLFSQTSKVVVKAGDEFENKGVFAKAYIPDESLGSGTTNITNIMNPFAMQLEYDATNPRIEPAFSKKLAGNSPVSVAKFRIETSGVKPSRASHLKVHGTISAQWKTDLVKTTNCTSNASQGGLSGGFLGFALSFLGFKTEGVSCNTNQQYKSQLLGCDPNDASYSTCKDALKSELKFDYYSVMDSNMDRLLVQECVDTACTRMQEIPYSTWMRATLLAMWMESNFDTVKDSLGQMVLNPTGLANGEIRATMNSKVELQVDRSMPLTVTTDVFISKVSSEDTLIKMIDADDQLKCAQKRYDASRRFFGITKASMPVPVHPDCLE